MKSDDVRKARHAMLREPHMLALTEYVERQQQGSRLEIPYFDPLDGGTNARVLFLFEKPGPMTSIKGEREGSGFISRDNDDKTAEATFNFMRTAKISREDTIIWNVVPGWNGTRKITSEELKAGCAEIVNLVSLLPKLQSIVFVGKKAEKAKNLLAGLKLIFHSSPHPSPIVASTNRKMWESIPKIWAKVSQEN